MTLFGSQNRSKRTNSLPAIPRLRLLIEARRGIASAEVKECDPPTYSDATTQHHFIGQQPAPPRRSSKTFVSAWRTQNIFNTASQKDRGGQRPQSEVLAIAQVPHYKKQSSARLPLPSPFVSSLPHKHNLRNQTSMSFPYHIRARSQPPTTLISPNSIQFPTVNEIAAVNPSPWWNGAARPAMEERNIKSKVIAEEPLQPQCRMVAGMRENLESHQASLTSTPPVHITFTFDPTGRRKSTSSSLNVSTGKCKEEDTLCSYEESDSSETSFKTCPSLPGEQECNGLEYNAALSLDSNPDALPDRLLKDPCQSPSPIPFSFLSLQDDTLGDQSSSVEVWGEQPEGISIERFEERIHNFVSGGESLRQERLQKWSTSEHLSNQSPVEPNYPVTPAMISNVSKSPSLKNRLSLSDFLNELRGGEIEEVHGEESFESSSLDEEEENSVQICRAWRGNIAFAGLGASLANEPLHLDSSDDPIIDLQVADPPLLHKTSRVSMIPVDLDPIPEVSITSWQSSVDDSLQNFDLCAHLLKRAKESKGIPLTRATL